MRLALAHDFFQAGMDRVRQGRLGLDQRFGVERHVLHRLILGREPVLQNGLLPVSDVAVDAVVRRVVRAVVLDRVCPCDFRHRDHGLGLLWCVKRRDLPLASAARAVVDDRVLAVLRHVDRVAFAPCWLVAFLLAAGSLANTGPLLVLPRPGQLLTEVREPRHSGVLLVLRQALGLTFVGRPFVARLIDSRGLDRCLRRHG